LLARRGTARFDPRPKELSGPLLRAALIAVVLLAGLGTAAPARAELSAALDGRALIGFDQRYGGAVMLDVWAMRSWIRVGGATGLGALSANDKASSRVLTPLALSLAVIPDRDGAGFVGVLRAGGYGGGQKSGLIGGAFFSGTLGYGFSLGEGASIRLAAELWGLVGSNGGLFVGPTLGLGF
jgi:hypothetical protein